MTPRQREMLAHVANGMTLNEVGQKLHVSYHTVRNSLDDAKERVGAKSLAHAVLVGLREGFLLIDADGTCKPVEEHVPLAS